jgi:three-Cys-motif partner protein
MEKDLKEKEHHKFGGEWTDRKLAVLKKYLHSYTGVLKNTSFQKLYIDAFAGTGYREVRRNDKNEADTSQHILFPDLAQPETQDFLDGSARLALQVQPPFDRYIFVEQRSDRCADLSGLKSEFPSLADRIDVRQGDANNKIQELCIALSRLDRAVCFLDPYGMQVEWTTIQAIAQTKKIDLWLLFPLGIGVNRLLKKKGDIPEQWRHRLNLLLGTENWYNEFYEVQPVQTLFGEDEERLVKVKMETIGRYFIDRLKRVFAGVAQKPGVLRNSANNPLYLLCFAVGNERGKEIALRIAEHLLKEVR